MKTKLAFLLSTFSFLLCCSAAGPLPTPFIFYSFDEYGSPRTNAVTLTPWPNTNQIVAVSNYVVGYRARTYNPDTNGYVAGYAMPNVYKLTIADDEIDRGLIFGMPLSASTQNVALLEGVLTYNTRNFVVAQLGDAGTMCYTNGADFIAAVTNIATALANSASNSVFVNAVARSNAVWTYANAASNSVFTDSVARSNANWLDVRSDPLGAGRLAGTNTWTGTNNFNHFGVASNGTWYGASILNAIELGGVVGKLANGTYDSPTLTNAINYGSAFSSPGSGAASEQFAGGIASGDNSIAIGALAEASEYYSMALGAAAEAGHTNSVAIGTGAVTDEANQIVLGGVNVNVLVRNKLTVSGGSVFSAAVTNLTVSGRTIFPAESDISFGRFAITTLANGNNDDLAVGTNVFIQVSGPTAAFAIRGIASPRDGKMVIILNKTGYDMTIACEGGASGNQATAANRIITLTGADRATTGNGAATLIYSASESRWQLIALDP